MFLKIMLINVCSFKTFYIPLVCLRTDVILPKLFNCGTDKLDDKKVGELQMFSL